MQHMSPTSEQVQTNKVRTKQIQKQAGWLMHKQQTSKKNKQKTNKHAEAVLSDLILFAGSGRLGGAGACAIGVCGAAGWIRRKGEGARATNDASDVHMCTCKQIMS
jgi:hypothetical protein